MLLSVVEELVKIYIKKEGLPLRLSKEQRNFIRDNYSNMKNEDICNKLNIESEKIDFLPIEAISNKNINHPMKYHLGIVDDYINCESYDLEYDIRENILICSTRETSEMDEDSSPERSERSRR